MLFNKSEVKASLKSDARYVSILRDPTSLLYSAYTYFRWRERFNYSSFEDFVIRTKSTKQIDPLIISFKNLMMFDFGLHPKNYEDDAIVDSKIAEIESTFDLIMIRDGEYFKQSLILLKNLMHWTVIDVAVVAINKMMSSAPKPVFSKSLTHHLLEANQADYKLYRKFLTIFKEKVKKFGAEKMKKELEELNYTTNKLANFCIAGTKRGSRNTTVYILSKAGEDNCYCRLLVASEKDLTRQLRQRYNKKRKKEVCRIRGYL
ncbi:hypothetical protein EB796_020153 [Bugula neritina]|uniref:Galactosylceramide sulfotransferase-like n=1 Tax=Bugula neritina TaxID=10212 RepID=A0A7J7J5U8_BUGNE|nr:hypothetical protein EB796_020153 [Bugula neritina]